ncbi:D-alanyl-D-alanine carboxypeptidase [Microbacterium halimionae]|uniref:D-alanyl-D-alanine carboxypeptidase n=1 Tax=Microbacterium halimionae TaxID=1526413 RepID=A0A7W3JLJ8_9MICO|nr:serine hydrolase domain-containing protein [Microbacterium halimionae]MBA8815090.1 D-alanyl-D-alanine carboxypeptidase [Microbacterium halimionae]NII94119.1 D-alanyl-D-alanine carboxypeptidase [Microbacterium halimionae]
MTGTFSPSATLFRCIAAAASVLTCALVLGSCADGRDDSARAVTETAAEPGAFTVVEDTLDSDVTAALNAAGAAAFAETSSPGAVLGVRTDDGGTWIATVGFADWDETEPMTADMYQRVGSIAKTFTVSALMQLAEAGELSLDDPIGDYIPGIPNESATLAQLAEMRSGIPSYTFNEEFLDELFVDPARQWEPEELVDLIRDEPAMFAPGEAMFYSNTNTVLLGLVIEQITGEPLDEVLAERVFAPAGLTHTSLATDDAYPDPHPQGYTMQGLSDEEIAVGEPVDVTNLNPSWGWAAGAAISTIDDLLTWGEVLGTGDGILSPGMQDVRLSSFDFDVPIWAGPEDRIPQTPERAYGMGLGLAMDWYGHEGALPGYNAYVQYYEPAGITLAVMTNSDIVSGECDSTQDTAANNPGLGPCQTPVSHMGDAIAEALGHPLVP